ncbi:MAG: iron-sulfur cluster repair di-iron protein [Candidatus Acidiferrales bacterium]
MPIETAKTVRDLVLDTPAAARIFENLGIDYCCGGNKPLNEACDDAHVSMEEVIAALEKPETVPPGRDWRNVPLSEVVAYIVEKHHVFTCDEIKRLMLLISKVISVHGKNHPELLQVQSLFRDLSQELTTHMMREEQLLFPYITEMEEAISRKRPLPSAMFGTVQNPVRMMMLEHDSSGRELRKMRGLTDGYVSPPDACVTYQTLYRALEAFERDLHEHIHLENNILFPRSVELEAAAF